MRRFATFFDNTAMATPPRSPGSSTNPGFASIVAGDTMLKRSPDSAAMVDYWDQTDAIIDGIKTLRLAGDKYLPKFTGEEKNDYDWRLKAATKFTNVYRDIVESLASKPFEQEITLPEDTIPEMLEFAENVDGAGNNLTMFAASTFYNAINSAIDWIFVDHPPLDPSIRNIADKKSRGVRPFWSRVLGRNVLWPKVEMINGHETLVYIKIFEPGNPDHVREFERLPTGQIVWRLYEKSEKIVSGDTQFVLINEGSLTIDVIPLVPFYTGRRDGRTFRFFPSLADAADLSIELYQQESGLKFAKIMTAYPMLAGNGVKPPMDASGKTPQKLRIGPNMVLYSPPDGQGNSGSWSFIEPAATSLTFLASDIKATIDQLRELGRQPLTAQSGNLTVITTAVAAGKSRSAVKAWALGLKDALENAFVITSKFIGVDAEVEVNVYSEFDDTSDDTADLPALQAARESRDISRKAFRFELKRRGTLAPEYDGDEDDEELLNETPGDVLSNPKDKRAPITQG